MAAQWRSLEIGGQGSRSFILRSPLLPAAGFLGYGRSYPGLLEPRDFGALVTQTTTLRPLPKSGSEWPGFARTTAGFILPCPPPNPGLDGAIREFSSSWRAWQVPVLLSVFARDESEAAAISSRLEHEDPISGIELLVPEDSPEGWLAATIAAFCASGDLPLLAKLPLAGNVIELAQVASCAGAAALVLGSSHRGASSQTEISGPVYGPATFPYTLHAVRTLATMTELPIIASGGVYSVADVAACLHAGASAVQIDGLIYLDPKAAAGLAREFPGSLPSATSSA